MRDGYAALALSPAVVELGYRYSTPIFNFPSDEPIDVDASWLRPRDLIVITTRPPMNDHKREERRASKRSNTSIEKEVFKALRKYLTVCSRGEVVLSDAAAATSPEVAKRASMLFRQNNGSTYLSYGSPVTREFVSFQLRDALTAVFLIYVEQAWPGGPGLLAAFGMAGTETLVWCHRLATEYRHLLCTTPFVMGEMRTGRIPDRPDTMDFARSWEITILGPTGRPASDEELHAE
jgi:hypothetical protein